MEKLLLTGGTGFIGRNTLPLLRQHYDVSLLTSRDDVTLEGVEVITCNLLDPDATRAAVAKVKADKLFHLAWGMEPSNYNLPANFDWLAASMQLIRDFHHHGGNAICVAGSCVQYAWETGGCDEQLTPTTRSNLYGGCKNILQEFALTFCESNDMQCLWARPFFMYGPFEDERRLVASIVYNLIQGKEAVVNNGGIYRDFLHARDVGGLMLDLFTKGQSGVFNIGSGQLSSLGEIGHTIATSLDREDLLTVRYPEVSGNRYVFAKMDKVAQVTDWQPSFSLQDGLQQTIEWSKQHVKS